MIYLVAILSLAAATVLGAPTDVPLEKQQPTVIPIISQSEELEPNGTYKFSYETGNGIKREEISYDKVVPRAERRSSGSNEGGESDESDEIHVQQGSYSYTAPDGTVITLRYIADENGFQAFGDHLPRAPVPLQVSSGSTKKSGRVLKTPDSVEAASAPLSSASSDSESKPAQETPEAKPESEPASAAPEAGQDDITSKSAEVPAISEQSAPEPDQGSTGAAESTPAETPEQPTSVAAAESTTVGDSEQPVATGGAEPTTLAASEQPTTAAAAEPTVVSAEQPTTSSDDSSSSSTVDQPAPEVKAENSPTIDSEQPAPVPNAEESTTAIADQPAPSVNAEEPTSATVADSESNSANAAEQPTAVPAPEQPAPSDATLQTSDAAASTTVSS